MADTTTMSDLQVLDNELQGEIRAGNDEVVRLSGRLLTLGAGATRDDLLMARGRVVGLRVALALVRARLASLHQCPSG